MIAECSGVLGCLAEVEISALQAESEFDQLLVWVGQRQKVLLCLEAQSLQVLLEAAEAEQACCNRTDP